MASENEGRTRAALFRTGRKLLGLSDMWWTLVAGITDSALKKESNCLLKRGVKSISFPLTKITAFFLQEIKQVKWLQCFFIIIHGLNQTFTTGCKIGRHFLTWSRGVYPVYSFSFCIPGGAFSVHSVGQILNVFGHDFSQKEKCDLYLGPRYFACRWFFLRFLVMIYPFLRTRVKYPRQEQVCHTSKVCIAIKTSLLSFPLHSSSGLCYSYFCLISYI